jgi:hypothetical protein
MENAPTAPRRAWFIDDVVKDVLVPSTNSQGETVMVPSAAAEVHIGPYADVRSFHHYTALLRHALFDIYMLGFTSLVTM